MTKEKKVSITIDNRKVEAKAKTTILQAARDNGIDIPSLCALEHLPSYGACRLCVVEVDGIRGFPTSCTTPVEEGMVIRTDTTEVRTLRQEVLKLLLSEHPASCLFCGEQDECMDFQGTIRKVGVTTGCRYCPNDHLCELQEITQKVGLTETSYPVYYRNFPVEKEDPFYDRDYNLCILCGRCVRVCNEIRLNGTLSFKQRGKQTTIGPAFARTHLEAGCEFCGACVAVCPTGALSAKASKWAGKPDEIVESTCPYCPIGCTLDLKVKGGQVIDVSADYDSPTEHGLICVKGRFAIPEYVLSPDRLAVPTIKTSEGYDVISWDGALDAAADKIKDAGSKDAFVVVSPSLSNEDLYVAQRFAREVIGTEAILSSVLFEMGSDLRSFVDLTVMSEQIDIIEGAKGILSIGLDTTYGFTPLGIAVKKAARSGATLVTIDDSECNLDFLAEECHITDPAKWPEYMDGLLKAMAGNGKKDKPAQGFFKKGDLNVVILGPEAIFSKKRADIFERVLSMRNDLGWKVIVCHPYTNLLGMLAMGAFPGLKPGGMKSDGTLALKDPLAAIDLKKKYKVGYFIGEMPSINGMPDCDYIIYENALPAINTNPDLTLPASLFTESAGTTISCEGKILSFAKVSELYAESKPDWWIMSGLASKVKKGTFKFNSLAAIQSEIKKSVPGFAGKDKKIPRKKVIMEGQAAKGASRNVMNGDKPAAFRGVPLHDQVAGMKAIEERRHK
ncbi:MAG: molybdopterin-dependent oxidoreductase [Syntrophorhabdaceae bacterium]